MPPAPGTDTTPRGRGIYTVIIHYFFPLRYWNFVKKQTQSPRQVSATRLTGGLHEP